MRYGCRHSRQAESDIQDSRVARDDEREVG
jgi:hypothetical protein